jgi:putative ABC transport system permease protein
MFTSYFKIAVRNLLRAKGYTLINISGLAVGMAASVMIFLWVQSELTYDRFYSKTDRLFQVYNRDKFNGVAQAWETTPLLLGETLKREYPDIEEAARSWSSKFLLSVKEKHIKMDGAFADPGFLKMFDFKLISGNREKALSGNNGIVITRSLAEKLFGTTDVLGKIITLDHKDSFSVTAVIDNIPDNSKFSNLTFCFPGPISNCQPGLPKIGAPITFTPMYC